MPQQDTKNICRHRNEENKKCAVASILVNKQHATLFGLARILEAHSRRADRRQGAIDQRIDKLFEVRQRALERRRRLELRHRDGPRGVVTDRIEFT